ncbi:MAG: hypothetical protein AAF514_12570 [Verrucomicrobiota bacterium]
MEQDRLTFDWSKPGSSAFHALIALVAVLFLHALGFYLYQIGYPRPQRPTVDNVSLRMLAGTDFETQRYLRQMEDYTSIADRTMRLDRQDPLPPSPLAAETPSFARHQLKLMDLPLDEPAPGWSPDPETGLAVLPPLEPLSDPTFDPETVPSNQGEPGLINVRLAGPLSSRALLNRINWEPGADDLDLGHAAYFLRVDRRGRIEHLLPGKGPIIDRLTDSVKQLRFATNPEEDASATWGWLYLEW